MKIFKKFERGWVNDKIRCVLYQEPPPPYIQAIGRLITKRGCMRGILLVKGISMRRGRGGEKGKTLRTIYIMSKGMKKDALKRPRYVWGVLGYRAI